MGPRPKVLFLCSRNSCRSQMAEALLRFYAGDQLEVMSAGLNPAEIHPLTLRVLDERGVETGGLRPKAAGAFLGRESFRHVVIVSARAEAQCPTTWPLVADRQFWPFEDPVAFEGNDNDRIDKFREVRDAIEARMLEWLSHLRKAGEIV